MKKDQIAERGARMTRRDDRAYREYSREEQRRQPGRPAREMVLLHRGQATRTKRSACIYVLAGTNGAGKSSIGGAVIRALGADYFNPDEATRRIQSARPHLSERDANIDAWHHGKRLLEEAIARRLVFAFETTLGGDTMTALLRQALAEGIEVRMWYVGLATPELHIARVRARVARGGHDIPETRIRERYERSRLNLIRLLPHLTELRVFDNSADADPASGKTPAPLLVLHMVNGTVAATCDLSQVPDWAKPIVAAAVGLAKGS